MLARSVNAPQSCLKDSPSLCFRFRSLYLSNVTFGGSLQTSSKKSQNSLKEIDRIFTLGFVWENTFSLHFRVLETGWTLNFCHFQHVSTLRNFSFVGHSFLFLVVLFFASRLARSFFDSLPVDYSRTRIWLFGTSGPLRLPMSRFSFAMMANWNWSLQWIQECGSSIVWFVQNARFPRKFDPADCAIINYFNFNPDYVQVCTLTNDMLLRHNKLFQC